MTIRLKYAIKVSGKLNDVFCRIFNPHRVYSFVIVFVLLLVVVILPRIEYIQMQGGLSNIRYTQLSLYYRDLYDLIEFSSTIKCGILTYKAIAGLPYYFPYIKVVDLSYPVNLAYLKNVLLQNSPKEVVISLRNSNIGYLLLSPYTIQSLDKNLGFVFSKITRTPELSIPIWTSKHKFWYLFLLGPFRTEKIYIPNLSWRVYSKYTTCPFALNFTDNYFILHMFPKTPDDRVTIQNLDVPEVCLSNFDYLVINATGSENARLIVRFWLKNGSFFDLAYWKPIDTIVPFSLKLLGNATLRHDAYIGLKSSDGKPAFVRINGIYLVKVIIDTQQ